MGVMDARKLWSYKSQIGVYRGIRYGAEKEIFISNLPLAYTIGTISLELVGLVGSRNLTCPLVHLIRQRWFPVL